MFWENRGYVVLSGSYGGIPMTVIGTGMGGPAVAIALEELGHMGADTFIRVGSCGVFQPGQQPGDVIVGSGTVRQGGTSMAYLPPIFQPSPPSPSCAPWSRPPREWASRVAVGPGVAGDAFYDPNAAGNRELYRKAGLVFIEMESDTGCSRSRQLPRLGARGWSSFQTAPPARSSRNGACSVSARARRRAIRVGLEAMLRIALLDFRV